MQCTENPFISNNLSDYQIEIDHIGENLKKKIGNGKIIGLGAAAKATIVCNYFKLKNNVLAIYDNTPEKIGKFQPGTGIPILDWSLLNTEKLPMLIFPWNLEKEIKENMLKSHKNAYFISLRDEDQR